MIIIFGGILILGIYFAYKTSSKAEKRPIGQLTKEEIKSKTPEELADHVDGHTGGKIITLIIAVIIIIGFNTLGRNKMVIQVILK